MKFTKTVRALEEQHEKIHLLLSVYGVVIALCVIYFGVMPLIGLDTDSKIKELQTVQNQLVKQVEILIIRVDRSSFNLQCAELDVCESGEAINKSKAVIYDKIIGNGQ